MHDIPKDWLEEILTCCKCGTELIEDEWSWESAAYSDDKICDKCVDKEANELVVLSAEGIAEKIIEDYSCCLVNPNSIRDAAHMAYENGQLREWLRPEQVELREAVESLLKREYHGPKPSELINLTRTFDSLKRPKTV